MKLVGANLRLVVAPVFIAYFLAIQMPLELYWGNVQAQTSAVSSLLPYFVIFFVSISCLLCMPYAVSNQVWRGIYFCFLVALSLLIWVTASFLTTNFGVLAGLGLNINSSTGLAKLELIVWVLVPLLFALLHRKLQRPGFQFLLGLLALSIVFLAFKAGYESFQRSSRKEVGFTKELVTLSTRGNVIHIVLDELPSSLMSHYLKQEPSRADLFDGFTFFPQAISNYSSTLVSIPSMLSGTLYRNELDVNTYVENAISNSAFLAGLQHSGFEVDLHTIPALCNRQVNYRCNPIAPGTHYSTALVLLDISLFRSLPTTIKPYLLQDNSWLISGSLLKGEYELSRYGMAHLLFKDFVDQLVVGDGPPTYKLFHSLLTHSPQLLDRNCNLLPTSGDKSLASRSAEMECALGHVTRLMEKLKTLKLYDSSLIIISADHGTNPIAELEAGTLEVDAIAPLHKARAKTTLLIKPINAHGKMISSTAQVSLLDIPNTVLEAFEIATIEQGENVFRVQEGSSRERSYFYYNWLFGAGENNRLNGFVRYSINCIGENDCQWKRVRP